MKLNLGSCDERVPGFLSVDRVPPTDVIADLTQAWPWPDSSVEEVLAIDIFEHLPDKIKTMNELWRVLKPGGTATIEIPCAAHGAGAFQDPTHVSFWTGNDFEYFEAENPNWTRFKRYYGVRCAFRVLEAAHRSYEGKWDQVWKFRVRLEAIK